MRSYPANALVLPASVVTVGAFDGLHLGHQALIRMAVERARTFGVPAVVYTFDPPPRCYLQKVPMLMPLDEKLRSLEELGVDHVVLARFDEAYMTRSAKSFIEELQALHPVEMWVGRDFRFGWNRQGDIDELSAAFNVRVLDPICCARGEVISSSRIRSLIAGGRRKEALALMGGKDGLLAGYRKEEEGYARIGEATLGVSEASVGSAPSAEAHSASDGRMARNDGG